MPRQAYYQKNKKHLQEYNREYLRKWHLENDEYSREYSKQYRQNSTLEMTLKRSARRKANYRIETGELVRGGCAIAGCKILGEAHHEDYNKPLDVVWLCKIHHEAHHHKIQKGR